MGEVAGGTGGLEARLDDVVAAGARLRALGPVLDEVAGTLAACARSPDLWQAAMLCPVEVVAVEGRALGAAALAALGGAALGDLGGFLDEAAATLRATDAALTAALDHGPTLAGLAIGATTAVSPGSWPGLAVTALVAGPHVQPVLYDAPWLAEAGVRVAPGVVQGAGLVLGLAPMSGGHWPSTDYDAVVLGLIALGRRAGLFEDRGRVRVVEESRGRLRLPASTALSRLVGWQAGLYRHRRADSGRGAQGTPRSSRIRVIRLDPAPGRRPRWIVQVPGTERWSPRRLGTTADTTTNVVLLPRREQTLAERQVIEAMRRAGVEREGGPVLLTGHSQGGTIAAALACDERVRQRFDVRAVLTVGSPVGRFPVPEGVDVLSLEHEQDVVPRLDRRDNPAGPHWVTATGDAGEAGREDPLRHAHALSAYRDLAEEVETSSDDSLADVRARLATFSGEGGSIVYDATAETDPDAGQGGWGMLAR